MRIILIVFLFAHILTSCTQHSGNDHTRTISNDSIIEINVDLEDNTGIPYDSLIDNISFVRLETKDECLIGNISQLISTDSLIFISDKEITKNIYCFNRKGKFLYKIGKVGQGPGEYAGYYCYITMTPDKQQLVVMDYGKIIYYDLNGKFIKEEPLVQTYSHCEFINEELICGYYFFGNPQIADSPTVNVFRKDKTLEYTAFPTIATDVFYLCTQRPIRKFGNEIYFNAPFSQTFYKIKNNGISAAYHINIKNNGVPPIDKETDSRIYSERLNKTIYCEDFTILKDAAIFELRFPRGHGSPFLVYSFKTKSTYRCNMQTDNMLFYFHDIPIARDEDNTLIVPQVASDIIKAKNLVSNCPHINKRLLSELYDGLTEDSNPTLFFFHIKTD